MIGIQIVGGVYMIDIILTRTEEVIEMWLVHLENLHLERDETLHLPRTHPLLDQAKISKFPP